MYETRTGLKSYTTTKYNKNTKTMQYNEFTDSLLTMTDVEATADAKFSAVASLFKQETFGYQEPVDL